MQRKISKAIWNTAIKEDQFVSRQCLFTGKRPLQDLALEPPHVGADFLDRASLKDLLIHVSTCNLRSYLEPALRQKLNGR